MAIAGQTTELIGYRVSGFAPGSRSGSSRVSDDFELRHVAIEHAIRLDGLGWRDVLLHARVREYGEEFLDNLHWRPIGAPA